MDLILFAVYFRAVEILRTASATNHMSLLIARDEESRYILYFKSAEVVFHSKTLGATPLQAFMDLYVCAYIHCPTQTPPPPSTHTPPHQPINTYQQYKSDYKMYSKNILFKLPIDCKSLGCKNLMCFELCWYSAGLRYSNLSKRLNNS